ncbi:MAG: glycosyl hydrolase family 2 [Verrucomicrobiales bacterium]|nr:glycosyl hydrolase family 2 [Verrucomicrobiales bacterium]
MRLIRGRDWPAFVLVAFAFFSANNLSALQIEKLIPFAWTNSVRIEVSFSSIDAVRDVDVTAEIRDASEHALWSGKLQDISVPQNGSASFSKTISGLTPRLWSPAAANLYTLKVSAERGTNIVDTKSIRFGFRSFENRAGQFFLNGHPIFLRGIAINPPGRTIPSKVGETRVFAESYVRYLKSQHVNAIRLPEQSQVWFDVCDELGMMLFQGNYGSPLQGAPRKKAAPVDYDKSLTAYKTLFETYARHPSIVISILSNELPTSGVRGKGFHEFLTRACDDLKRWDSTRLYIGNAGYGEGREGDVKDAHRYWGWYYNTFLTYYNLRDKNLLGDPKKIQPITFTECVGSYTGPRGDFNISLNRQLGAQLNWTGHSTNQIKDALEHQRFMVQQATESFRRLRSENKSLAGIMPFTIFFYNWSGITSFEQMKPKPAMEQLGVSYQPVLLSWEMWTPNVYAGTPVSAFVHIINDDDEFRDLHDATLLAEIRNQKGELVVRRETTVPLIRYFKTWRTKMTFDLRDHLATGDYSMSGRLISEGRELAHNETKLFIAAKEFAGESPKTEVFLFDPKGRTKSALRKLNVPFRTLHTLKDLPQPPAALIIGEEALRRTSEAQTNPLRQFINTGGRVLCLRQDPKSFDPAWLPERIEFFKTSVDSPHYPPTGRPFSGHMNVNPERPGHPVFEGLNRYRLALWSDYTKWDQTKSGFPHLYPVTSGFRLKHADSLARTAILADYDRGLEGVALCEMFCGNGSVIVSAFDLTPRTGLDPAADRLLLNLIRFTTSPENHEAHPLIEGTIHWGDYASERGLVTGPLNGLLVNADWIVPPTDPSATPRVQGGEEWSTHPGDQFVPHGITVAGPFGYSFATSLRDLQPDSEEGTGTFWARIPSGKTIMRTKIDNRSTDNIPFNVYINGKLAHESHPASGKLMTITALLPANVENISVQYTGSKKLVILETTFE